MFFCIKITFGYLELHRGVMDIFKAHLMFLETLSKESYDLNYLRITYNI